MATFEYIIVESKGAVGIITLNRPKMLNALSFGVFREIAAAVDDLEADDKIGCILLTGSEKAFAAGADIKEMQPKSFIDMFSSDFAAIGGGRVATCRKPTIAAPVPSPANPSSEIGASTTRALPKRWSRPCDTLKAPWYLPTSSPMRKTLASRSISSASA